MTWLRRGQMWVSTVDFSNEMDDLRWPFYHDLYNEHIPVWSNLGAYVD
ncbi:MAG: hypothetical protein AB7O38_21800 [Pirellulaceae bacterium]